MPKKDARQNPETAQDAQLKQFVSELAFEERLATLVAEAESVAQKLRHLDVSGLEPQKAVDIYRRFYQRESEKSRLRLELFKLPKEIEARRREYELASSPGIRRQHEDRCMKIQAGRALGRGERNSLPEYPEAAAKRKLDATVGLLRSKEARLREVESHDAEWNALLHSVPQPSRIVSQAPAPPPPVEEPAQTRTSAPERKVIWWHSEDYRKIVFNGEAYRLTDQQASIIRLLDDARHTGDGCLSIQRIRAGAKCGRLADSFRAGDGPKLWKNLVVPETGYKGLYKLDLPDDLIVDPERNPA